MTLELRSESNSISVDTWTGGRVNGGRKECYTCLLSIYIAGQACSRPLYISSFDPHNSTKWVDNPCLTDEETEAQRDDLAQGSAGNHQQSPSHCGIRENSLSPIPH